MVNLLKVFWRLQHPLNRAAIIGLALILLGSTWVVHVAVDDLNRHITYRENMIIMHGSLDDWLSGPVSSRDREILEGWQQTLPQRIAIIDAGGPEAWRQGAEFRIEEILFIANRWDTNDQYGLADLEQAALTHLLTTGLSPEVPSGLNGFGLLERVAAWTGMLLMVPALLMGAASAPVSGMDQSGPLRVWKAIFIRLALTLVISWLAVLGLTSLLWGVGSITYPVAQGLVYKPLWGGIPEWIDIIPRWQYLLSRAVVALPVAFAGAVCTQGAVLLISHRTVGSMGFALLISGWYLGLRNWGLQHLYRLGLLTYADPGLSGSPGLRTIPLPFNTAIIVPIWLLMGTMLTLMLWRRGIPKQKVSRAGFTLLWLRRLLYSVRWRFILYFILSTALAGAGALALRVILTFLSRLGLLGKLLHTAATEIGTIPLLGLTGFTLFVALFFLLTRRETMYLEELSGAVQRIAAGDFSVRVPSRSGDELGDVADNMNKMAEKISALLEKERRQERTKAELIGGISHDLRTPLTSVSGYLELLAEGRYKDKNQRDRYTQVALAKARRLERMIDDLFEYTRLSGGIRLKRQALDLGALLTQLLVESEPLFLDSGVETRLHLPDQNVIIKADGDLLARVFDNLFTNAARYGRQGKYLDVVVIVTAERVAAQVTNYGPPISEADLPRIFQRFFRADKGHPDQGSGLGLAIARQIALLHGGDIDAESGPAGTTFTVWLPVQSPDQ